MKKYFAFLWRVGSNKEVEIGGAGYSKSDAFKSLPSEDQEIVKDLEPFEKKEFKSKENFLKFLKGVFGKE